MVCLLETVNTVRGYQDGLDYMHMLSYHRSTAADITVACLPVDRLLANFCKDYCFDLLKIDREYRIWISLRLHLQRAIRRFLMSS